MKILVIDNGSRFIPELKNALMEYDLSVVPFDKINAKSVKKFDKIILSGSRHLPVVNHDKEYKKEIEIIKNSGADILGICLGFELISHSFGEDLKRLDGRKKGIVSIRKIVDDILLNGIGKSFRAYESHRWTVRKANYLIPLAKSGSGIEVLKHPNKKIYGVQFHPEAFLKESDGWRVLDNFIKM